MSPPTCGVVYVAYGDRFIQEATLSASSLQASNPTLPRLLITDRQPAPPHPWDEVMLLPNDGRGGSAMKLQMFRAPWERCLFLDTDTLVIGDLSPVFQLLERFDLAGVQHSGGHHYRLPGLPPAFPEFNSGVIAWRRNDRVAAFFSQWNKHYDAFRDPSARNWDQKSLRLALYESDLRLAALPHGYNLMPYAPSVVEGEAVVLHGRNHTNLLRLKQRLSQSTRLRAYVPGLGVLTHPQELSWKRTLAFIARLFFWRIRPSLPRKD